MNPELMRTFIDALWDRIDYWENRKDVRLREKLERVVFDTLCSIDGKTSPHIHFKLVGKNIETGEIVELETLHEYFY